MISRLQSWPEAYQMICCWPHCTIVHTLFARSRPACQYVCYHLIQIPALLRRWRNPWILSCRPLPKRYPCCLPHEHRLHNRRPAARMIPDSLAGIRGICLVHFPRPWLYCLPTFRFYQRLYYILVIIRVDRYDV